MEEARRMTPGAPETRAVVAQVHLAYANMEIVRKLAGAIDEARVAGKRYGS
jgi:hypothetical protein